MSENSAECEILVVGVGNDLRGDDGLGIVAARELRRRLARNVRVIELRGSGATILHEWEGATHVFIVDAISSGGPPGTLYCIDLQEQSLPKHFLGPSSHALGVAEAIEYAKHLDTLPAHVMIVGIEAESFEQGIGLSNSVVRSFPDLLHLIEQHITSITEHAAASSNP